MKRGTFWKCHFFDTEREITCRRKYLFNRKPFYYVLSTLSDKKWFGGRSNTEINTFTMQITQRCVNAGRALSAGASHWVQAGSDFLFSDLSFIISVLCLSACCGWSWRDMNEINTKIIYCMKRCMMCDVNAGGLWVISELPPPLQSSQKRKVYKRGRQRNVRDLLTLRAEDENNGW